MMKQCPSFSTRPGFPKGLKVLVVDDSAIRSADTESLLKECGYSPLMCMSSAEAIQHLINISGAPDIMLIEVTLLAQKTPENAVLLAAAKTLPLVLMAANLSPKEIISGINKQGAVDFIEQPLHLHKLKNIWQHVVRRQMLTAGSENSSGTRSARTSVEVSFTDSPSIYSTGGADSIFTGGVDSIFCSNSPLLEQEAMELDPETSSLFDTAELALGSPLSGLSQGFSDLLMGDLPPMSAGLCSKSSSGCGISRVVVRSKGRMSGELRRTQHPLMQHRTMPRPCALVPPAATKAASQAVAAPAPPAPAKPVTGHSCGKLPPLGAAPGMAWGLPTNPLFISPKPMPLHMAGMMMPPWLHPMMMPGHPGMMMPPMMSGMCGMPPHVMGMLPMPPRQMAGMSMPPMLPAAALPPQRASAPAHSGMFRRAETSPLLTSPNEPLAASMVHSISFAAPSGGCMEKSLSSCDSPAASPTEKVWPSSLLVASAPQKPPIGLQLHKSPSLMNMINLTLERAVKGAASIF